LKGEDDVLRKSLVVVVTLAILLVVFSTSLVIAAPGLMLQTQFDPAGLTLAAPVQTKITGLVEGLILRELPEAQRFTPVAFNKIVSQQADKYIVGTLVILAENNSERGESYYIRAEIDTATGTSRTLEKVRAGEMDRRLMDIPGNALLSWERRIIGAPELQQMELTFKEKEQAFALAPTATLAPTTATAPTATLSPTAAIAPKAVAAFPTPETAYAGIFVPLSQQNPPAGTTGTNVKNWFTAKGKQAMLYMAPNSTAANAWPFIKNGKRLYVLYYCCHGDTSASDLQPCYGTIMSGSEMFWYQYRDVYPYIGLVSCVVYVCGCNTFMNPLNDGITKAEHHVRTYIASQRLVPMAKSPIFNSKFWDKVINKNKTMATAMQEAANETPLVNYFMLEGNSGRPIGL